MSDGLHSVIMWSFVYVQVGTWHSKGRTNKLQLFRGAVFPGDTQEEPFDTVALFENVTFEVVTIIVSHVVCVATVTMAMPMAHGVV